jgi:3-hydroxyisobutyrate dehydrogenase-like beta-hydroxyacid dehydrogenase
MADDKKNVGEPDRSLVAGGQDYEVQHFAQKYGLSAEQVRELIARVGNDREKLEQAAKQMKSGTR